MHWKAAVLLMLLCGLWSLPVVHGQKLSGELTLVRGVLKIRRQGQEILLRTPEKIVPLFEKDVVQTGPQSQAILKLRLKKIEKVRLYSDSYLMLEAVGGDRTTMVLSAGKAEFSVYRSLPSRTHLEVKTHRLVISTQRAKFVVGVEFGGAYVAALEGEITVTLAATQKVRSELPPDTETAITSNQAIISTAGEIFSNVVEIEEEELEQITAEDGLESFRELEPPPSEQTPGSQSSEDSGDA